MVKIRKKISYVQKIYLENLDTIRETIVSYGRIDVLYTSLYKVGFKPYIDFDSLRTITFDGEHSYRSTDDYVLFVPLMNFQHTQVYFYDEQGVYEHYIMNKPMLLNRKKDHSIIAKDSQSVMIQINLKENFTIDAIQNSCLNNNPY
jgi:hypothetical protein